MARPHSKSQNTNAYLDEKATRREVLTAVMQLLAKHEQQHHQPSVVMKMKNGATVAFGKPNKAQRLLGWLRGAR